MFKFTWGISTNMDESEFHIVALHAVGPIFKLTGLSTVPNTEPQRVIRELPVSGPLLKTTAVIFGAMYSKYAS